MRFTTVPDVPSPIMAHTHSAGRLCDECTGNVRIAAEAIVAHILASLNHAPAGDGRCGAPAARASGWGLVIRVAALGPAGLLVAYDHLAGIVEAGACGHRRNDLGAPDLMLIMRPAALLATELAAEVADGTGSVQRYMDHRAQTAQWARAAPMVAEAAGLNLGRHGGSRLGLAVLAMCAAGAELSPPPPPPRPGPGPSADPFDGIVLTAENIAAAEAAVMNEAAAILEAAAGPNDERPTP